MRVPQESAFTCGGGPNHPRLRFGLVFMSTADLVRIPSVNPMGRPASGDIYYEHRVTGHLEALFRGLGLPIERHMVAPLRDNIVTRVEGDTPPERGGKIVMLEAHQDTVPV